METRSYTASVQIQNEESLFERGYVVVNEDEINSTRVMVRLRGQRLALGYAFAEQYEGAGYSGFEQRNIFL